MNPLLDLLQLGKPRPHRSDLIRQPRDFLFRSQPFLKVGHIEGLEISADALRDLFHAALELAAREIAVSGTDGLELGSVDRGHAILEHADVDTEADELRAEGLDRRAVVLAKVEDCLEIGSEATRQPHHLDIAPRLLFQASARLQAVEIAVEIELEQRRGVVRGRPVVAGDTPVNPKAPRINSTHLNWQQKY